MTTTIHVENSQGSHNVVTVTESSQPEAESKIQPGESRAFVVHGGNQIHVEESEPVDPPAQNETVNGDDLPKVASEG